jgi:Spy/CpxP family protein refolding chaperone
MEAIAMKRTSLLAPGLIALALAAASGSALSQGGPPPGAGRGPGMMGDGPGPMTGGAGYGQGMMGGSGYGQGMMGGRGPGTMGGYGPGMMGGAGGPGYGRQGGLAALDLTDDQREKLATLREQARRKSWDAMGQLRTEQFKLRQMFRSDAVDVAAVVDQQKKVDDLRRQLMQSRLEMRNEMVATLTAEQKKKLREGGPWWFDDDSGI